MVAADGRTKQHLPLAVGGQRRVLTRPLRLPPTKNRSTDLRRRCLGRTTSSTETEQRAGGKPGEAFRPKRPNEAALPLPSAGSAGGKPLVRGTWPALNHPSETAPLELLLQRQRRRICGMIRPYSCAATFDQADIRRPPCESKRVHRVSGSFGPRPLRLAQASKRRHRR